MVEMYTVNRAPLADDWSERAPEGYDVVIVGSGYGGAITAARLTSAQWPNGKPSICVLERGKEWLPSQFPDTLNNGATELRQPLNPLGLYDFRFGTDIGVLMGSGLGGTSLVNANVALEPDPEVFEKAAAALGAATTDCVIFEDSPTGAEAARRAGSPTIMLTTTHTAGEFAHMANVRATYPDFRGLTLERIRRLV